MLNCSPALQHRGPVRVLLVGDFDRSAFGAQYYNTSYALQNGLIRAGCHVMAFSDRDTARERSVLRRKILGRNAMNRALIAHANTYRPHLVLLSHADMTCPETLDAIRAAVDGVILAQVHVDAVFRTKAMERFRARSMGIERSFITTADPEARRSIGAKPGTLAFFPNPLDASIATANVATRCRTELPYDVVFLGNGDFRREAQILELQEALHPDVRFLTGGRIFDTPRIYGPTFLETLAEATMSPNLPLDDRRPVDELYSSNRIAHLFAQGLLAFCHQTAGLDALYEDGIVTYGSIADLAEKMSELTFDDARRRQIALKGWQIARERTSAERVARYLLEMCFDDRLSEAYEWPTDCV